ncbi:hypothetical protein CTEN210_04321 [Chaetoceros tenuissimus]|uniref:MYND-type domain-containing protein n=1 Tax=Chaetoceros tenuissimus TaxID=426638 RepID=A0AAD3CML8_9STRA|nr:hypothetical protein CTEN210_04321 [Chaetoceros tenuissimus]
MPSRKKKAGRRRLQRKKETGGAKGRTAPEKTEYELMKEHLARNPSIEEDARRIESILSRTVEERKIFDEFMIWSFSDKADLTSNKFAKMAPGIANMLLEGKVAVNDLVFKRGDKIPYMEQRSKSWDIQLSLTILVSSLDECFSSTSDRQDFEKKLQSALLLEQMKNEHSLMSTYRQDVFQKVASEWFHPQEITDKCVYYNASEDTFQKYYEDAQALVIDNFTIPEDDNNEVLKKYYLNSNLRLSVMKDDDELFFNEENKIFSILKLHKERWRCWQCNEFGGKSQLCAGCNCAVYCSRKCQVKHWKVGHKDSCKENGKYWSRFETCKKRIAKALKDERVYTKQKQFIVDGVEKESSMRPCEKIVSQEIVRLPPENFECASIDTFYENMAILAGGGTHPIFGEETITPKLQKMIDEENYESIFSDFSPKNVTENDIRAMVKIFAHLMLGRHVQQFQWESLRENSIIDSKDLSVERFIAFYICFETIDFDIINLFKDWDKFQSEHQYLQELRWMQYYLQRKNGQTLDT